MSNTFEPLKETGRVSALASQKSNRPRRGVNTTAYVVLALIGAQNAYYARVSIFSEPGPTVPYGSTRLFVLHEAEGHDYASAAEAAETWIAQNPSASPLYAPRGLL